MTSKEVSGNALRKKKKLRTAGWPPPPLIIPSPPEPGEIAQRHSAVANRFYSDFRSSIYRTSRELGAAQVSGMLIVDAVEAHPRGTMPGPLWDRIREQFEGALRDLLLGHSNTADIAAEDQTGRCRLRLSLAPYDIRLALQGELDHTPPGMEQVDQRIRKLLVDLPADYDAIRARLTVLSDKFRVEVGRVLQDPLNKRLAEMPHDTYEDKQQLVSWLKSELRHFGLAVKCPKTGRASLLQADVGRHPSRGRFQTDNADENGKRERPMSFNELIPLEFIPEDFSRESSAKWADRTQRPPQRGSKRRG